MKYSKLDLSTYEVEYDLLDNNPEYVTYGFYKPNKYNLPKWRISTSISIVPGRTREEKILCFIVSFDESYPKYSYGGEDRISFFSDKSIFNNIITPEQVIQKLEECNYIEIWGNYKTDTIDIYCDVHNEIHRLLKDNIPIKSTTNEE